MRSISRKDGSLRARADISQSLTSPGCPGYRTDSSFGFYTDGDGYVLSLKDTRDPCHYGIFSDQHGRLYEMAPQVPLVAR